ncbi:hypothetical protein LMH87_001629 [Akanthomyces muscarius]|uniref:Uncharacterized protein n=1 Tax=Akanthomyces muscarius TaxID=2231603 RepID=A0A9W8UGB0_AKAMU|nr:hypothetical protein LMH87_001629 [Akanthomyces muscarius]KAJ4147081.1 hypothetical protein LMH87_001629 [Akanthomyces muscarius]
MYRVAGQGHPIRRPARQAPPLGPFQGVLVTSSSPLPRSSPLACEDRLDLLVWTRPVNTSRQPIGTRAKASAAAIASTQANLDSGARRALQTGSLHIAIVNVLDLKKPCAAQISTLAQQASLTESAQGEEPHNTR